MPAMDWTYYVPVAIAVAVGVYGVVKLQRLPPVGRIGFGVVATVFGVAAAATGYIHTGPRAIVAFAVSMACVLILGGIWWVYGPRQLGR